MITQGILELDLHGMNSWQAKTYIDSQLKRATPSIYRLRIIHGYQHGATLRDMVRNEYRRHPKVLRIELSFNQGQTDLVLREFT